MAIGIGSQGPCESNGTEAWWAGEVGELPRWRVILAGKAGSEGRQRQIGARPADTLADDPKFVYPMFRQIGCDI